MQAANQQVQRIYNRSLILSRVRREKLVSRTDLSRATGLEKSSVSAIVNDLVAQGLLVQLEQGRSTAAGGRRPIYLGINQRFCSFLGVEIQPRRYRAALVDLAGSVIHRETGEVPTTKRGFARTLQDVFQKLDPAVRSASAPLAAVSVGVPGYVNPRKGTISRSIPLGLVDFDFSHVSTPWGVSAWIENDANCCGWAELLPEAAGARDFLVLLMEYQEDNPLTHQKGGISTGFGIVIGGEIYYGAEYASGEFKSLFWRAGHKSQVGIADDRMAGAREDPGVYQAYLEEILLHLSPLVSVFDPERIVFCGDASPSLDRIHQLLRGPLSGTWIAERGNARRIGVSSYGGYAVAIGAAARLLISLFKTHNLSGEGSPDALDWRQVLESHGSRKARSRG